MSIALALVAVVVVVVSASPRASRAVGCEPLSNGRDEELSRRGAGLRPTGRPVGPMDDIVKVAVMITVTH